MPTSTAELDDIESYYDTVPRASATAEDLGPFTVFVSQGSFPFYARPRLGVVGTISPDEVSRVRARQREIGVPEAFEWVSELQPDLAAAVRATGLAVYHLPLMLYRGGGAAAPPSDVKVRVIGAEDPALPQVQAAIGISFGFPGTAAGSAGERERDAAEQDMASAHQGTRDRIASGMLALVGAFAEIGAVGGGSHSPRGTVTEVTGVATLPAYRRRGIGAAVTALLVADAHGHGVRSCFLSAGSEQIARVYARAGFERIGTACVAGASD